MFVFPIGICSDVVSRYPFGDHMVWLSSLAHSQVVTSTVELGYLQRLFFWLLSVPGWPSGVVGIVSWSFLCRLAVGVIIKEH